MMRGKFELEHLEPTKDPLSTELNSGKFTVSVSIEKFTKRINFTNTS